MYILKKGNKKTKQKYFECTIHSLKKHTLITIILGMIVHRKYQNLWLQKVDICLSNLNLPPTCMYTFINIFEKNYSIKTVIDRFGFVDEHVALFVVILLYSYVYQNPA